MLLAAAKELYVGYRSTPSLFDQHCSAWGTVPAQGNGHWLPHLPGLGLRGGSSNVGNVHPQVMPSIVSGLGVFIFFFFLQV